LRRKVLIDELRSQLQEVFRDVFDDDGIIILANMTANDIEGWDSLMHINLIIAVEKRFNVKFATAEISGLKEEGQNVGTFLQLLARKLGDSA
jgi:acyl carrier protein